MTKFEKNLVEYGVDFCTIKERFVGDMELYKDCLCLLANDSYFTYIKEAVEKNNIKDAFDYAYSLKGVCANLGLVPLFKSVSEFADYLDKGEIEKADVTYNTIIYELSRASKLLA